MRGDNWSGNRLSYSSKNCNTTANAPNGFLWYEKIIFFFYYLTISCRKAFFSPPSHLGPAQWSSGPGLNPSFHALPVLARFLSAYSGLLKQSKDMHAVRMIGDSNRACIKTLIGDCRMAAGVNLNVNCCLSLYDSSATDWQPVQGVPHLSPCDSWNRLQTHCDPEWDKQKRWMDWITGQTTN